MSVALPVVRGCGTRKEGGIYWTLGMGPGGRPLEDFLMDPPVPVPANVEVVTRGVSLLAVAAEDGTVTYHVVDRIGGEYYPNVTDFIEEVRRFGMSRRLQRSLDFSKLGPDSRILLVHDRASVDAHTYYRYLEEYPWSTCPKDIEDHPLAHTCCGFWWHDIDPATVDAPDSDGWVFRSMPSFTYQARIRPDGLKPTYQQAFFASFPCTRLEVVRGEGSEQSMSAAVRSALVVTEVDL